MRNNLLLLLFVFFSFSPIVELKGQINEIYEEAYNRGITTVLHVGDIVDGNYPNRPENPRQQFLHGFDEQAGYVADMYPEILMKNP